MSTIQDATLYADLGLSRSLQDSSKSNELGQEDFLKLMTTQLKHQDPTKPADNAEFMSQLAQFGTVTGIEDLKTEIQNLAGSLVSNQTFQAAGMLGREVLIPATQGVLEQGGVIEGAVELSNAVSSLNIGIYDLTGQLVRNVVWVVSHQGWWLLIGMASLRMVRLSRLVVMRSAQRRSVAVSMRHMTC